MLQLRHFLLAVTILLISQITFGQQKYTISGYIKDGKTGESLIGATVAVKETGDATGSNAYGFYSITLPEGKYTISYQYLGYSTVTKEVDLSSNLKMDVEIGELKVEQLQEVEINADREANVKSVEMSVNKLDIRQISKIPALLGEVDVIRSIQLLPGVSTVGEGASGFNVRGGSIDQNLVLIDEAPVYNSSHLFGFFSVFNPDAVKDVKLFKGGIPAQYGGRLSSILDVRLKEGNSKRFAGQGGIGSIFSRLTLEGPIKKNQGSFIVAGRRSYIDVLAAPALANNEDFKDLALYFYDFTAKGNYTLGKRDKIFVSSYLGRDVFGVGAFGFNWGNATLSTRWSHVFTDKVFMNITGFYSNYDYRIGASTGNSGDSFDWRSNIINYSIKPEFSWFLNTKNTISFGGQAILFQFVPGIATFKSSGTQTKRELPDKFGLENALYVSNEQIITPRFTLTYGLRVSHFEYITKYPQNVTLTGTADAPQPTTLDTLSKTQFVKSYINPEPRVSFKYQLTDKSSIKGSYMRTAQYIHLASNTAASIPLDVWTPSTNNIKPQLADQFALGYFRNFGAGGNDYEFSIESYYKDMQNQIDYINGADLLLNPRVEGELIRGKGRAYGLELFVKKNSGKLTGWISYTLARTERLTDGINRGEWYPARFDRLHNLNIVATYQLTSRWSLSSNLVYSSGTPINLPTTKARYSVYTIYQDPRESRNNIRIPDYIRLDFAATLKNRKREVNEAEIPSNFFRALKYRYEWELVFGVYNVLGRRNPFGVFPQGPEDNPYMATIKQLSIVAVPIPSITYNFKF